MGRVSWLCRKRSAVLSSVSGLSCGLWLAWAWLCGWQSGSSVSDLLVSCIVSPGPFLPPQQPPCSPVLHREIPGRRRNLVPGAPRPSLCLPSFPYLLHPLGPWGGGGRNRSQNVMKVTFSELLVFVLFSKKIDFSWDMCKIFHQ